MSFDGTVTRALAHQLNSTLIGGRIDKVTQPASDEIILQIHKQRESFRLLISVNSACHRVCFTEEKRENPTVAPLFCMLLRKHLTSGKIISIAQEGLDRILFIDVEIRDELGDTLVNRLHIEMMGKHSNLIFYTLQTGRIIDSLYRIGESMSRIRQIHPGLLFESLETVKENLLNTSIFKDVELLKASGANRLSKALLETFQGLSPQMCKELLFLSHLEDLPREQWSDTALEALAESINTLRTKLSNHHYAPAVYRNTDAVLKAFASIEMTHLIAQGLTADPQDDISKTLELYYGELAKSSRMKQKSIHLRKIMATRIHRLEKKVQKLKEDYYYAENADDYKILGDLLTANIYQVQKGMTEITVANFYTPENTLKSIALDVRLSPSDNAQRYYKKYNKLKKAQTEVLKQLDETQQELEYLETVVTALDTCNQPSEIDLIQEELSQQGYVKIKRKGPKKKKDSFAPIEFTAPDGFQILVGRNNLENDRLTLKTASNSDLWFHTKDIPGSHVIIRTQGQDICETTLTLAAQLAAWYSKARQSENVPVDYTQVRHVRKPAGARPGRVIYDHQKTLYVTPVEPGTV